MSFQWGTSQTEKITFSERMKNPDSYNALLENAWTWDVWCLHMCFAGKALAHGWNDHFLGNVWMPTYAHAVLRTAWLAACSHLWFSFFLTRTICQDAETKESRTSGRLAAVMRPCTLRCQVPEAGMERCAQVLEWLGCNSLDLQNQSAWKNVWGSWHSTCFSFKHVHINPS